MFVLMLNDNLEIEINKRKEENAFRTLKSTDGLLDFCSNDYLGYAKKSFSSDQQTGSSGSRLISGHHRIHEEVELQIAEFHDMESALIFNSGYDANLSFFSTIPQKGDTVIYDQLCHASIRDGMRLGVARNFSFKHNSIEDLRMKLEQAEGNVFVAVESVYSMDGDMAPLIELEELCNLEGAYLVVDEAHATGVFGLKGEGLCQELSVNPYAKIHTFGKALGCHGATIVGDQTLRNYLINYARPFIYTTALPPHSIYVIQCAYSALENCEERKQLHENIEFFKSCFQHQDLIESDSPIQCVVFGDNEKCKGAASNLQEAGFDVRPILYPTVARGKERIRICLHSYNSQEEITQLCTELKKIK